MDTENVLLVIVNVWADFGELIARSVCGLWLVYHFDKHTFNERIAWHFSTSLFIQLCNTYGLFTTVFIEQSIYFVNKTISIAFPDPLFTLRALLLTEFSWVYFYLQSLFGKWESIWSVFYTFFSLINLELRQMLPFLLIKKFLLKVRFFFLIDFVVDCIDPSCTGHGACIDGQCWCKIGWTGINCSDADARLSQYFPNCSSHGIQFISI
jgi:hypothetical protein